MQSTYSSTSCNSVLDFLVTVFPNATDTHNCKDAPIRDVIDAIKSDEYKAQVQWIRQCALNNDPTAVEAKRQLAVICWAGTFAQRRADALTDYHGLVVLDIDDLETEQDAIDAVEQLRNAPHIIACFRSPGGFGIKPVFCTDATDPAHHGAAVLSAAKYLDTTYGMRASGGQPDVSRACFAGWDPGAWCKEPVGPLIVDLSLTIPATKSAGGAPSTTDKIAGGGRHAALIAYCARHARGGMSAGEIRAAVGVLISERFDLSDGRKIEEKEIDDAISSAIAKYQHGDPVGELAHGAELVAGLLARPTRPAEDMDPAQIADPGPLPARLLDLPGIGGEWIRYCLRSGTIPQPELALGAVLAACGAMIGPRLAMGTTRANVYIFGVAETGHGKDAARQAVRAVIDGADAPDVLGAENIISGAGLVAQLLANRARVFLLDEVGYMLASSGAAGAAAHLSGIPQTLLQIYSSSASKWRGGAYADAERNPEIDCPHACLYATTGPEKLWSAMSQDSLDGGLLGRCLFFFGAATMPDRRRVSPADCVPPADLVAAVRCWHQSGGGCLQARNGGADQMPVEPDAMDAMDAAVLALDALIRGPLAQHPARVVFARYGQQAGKLAMIRAWCRSQTDPVCRVEDAEWALDVVGHCLRRIAHHAAGRIRQDDNPWERAYQRTILAIQKAGGRMTQKQLYRAVRLPSDLLSRILDQAVEAGELIARDDAGDRGHLVRSLYLPSYLPEDA